MTVVGPHPQIGYSVQLQDGAVLGSALLSSGFWKNESAQGASGVGRELAAHEHGRQRAPRRLGGGMTSARIPEGSWTWRRTALVLGVALLPVLALTLLSPHGDRLAAVARADGMIVASASLVSAIACYAGWRINPRPALAWASFAVTLLGCERLLLAGVQLAASRRALHSLWLLAVDMAVALIVLAAALYGRRSRFRPDPVAAGFTVGAAVAVVRLVWVDRAPDLGNDVPPALAVFVFVTALVAAAAMVLRSSSIALWARQRLALTTLLIGAAQVALYLGNGATAYAAAVAGDIVGAVLLVSTCLALLFIEVEVDAESRSHLNDELERARGRIKVHRAQFHEVNSTLAGITSASRLLRSSGAISEQRRRLLEDMVIAELGRLERLMARQTDTSQPRRVDLDATIAHLVVSREARGQYVRWSPCGLHVHAQPDAVTEVINILLDNATKHGASTAEVTVNRLGDTVEVAVHDDGPGIEESLRRSIFDWGARGSRSTGQGIGLHIAHELMQRQGGYLEIRDGARGGATFVLGLPAASTDHTAERTHDGDSEAAPGRA
jgi:signal transduction histidine kinase